MQHPNAKWVGHARSGGDPRRDDLPVRGVVHTSETKAGTAEALFDMEWPYHLLVDVVTKEIYQLVRLDRTAYSLKGYSNMSTAYRRKHPAFETNHAGRHCVQVCLIGYAKDMHRLTGEQLDWLASEVFVPIMDLTGIPNEWHTPLGNGDGVVLATENYVGRLNPTEWYNFTGWAMHQTSPGQDHWDPGRLNTKGLKKRCKKLLVPATDDLPAMEHWGKLANDLDLNDESPIIEFMQRGLTRLGHYEGPFDGIKDDDFLRAWERFERAEYGDGKGVDTRAGKFSWPKFLNLVMKPTEVEAPPAPSADIRKLESQLAACQAEANQLRSEVVKLTTKAEGEALRYTNLRDSIRALVN